LQVQNKSTPDNAQESDTHKQFTCEQYCARIKRIVSHFCFTDLFIRYSQARVNKQKHDNIFKKIKAVKSKTHKDNVYTIIQRSCKSFYIHSGRDNEAVSLARFSAFA